MSEAGASCHDINQNGGHTLYSGIETRLHHHSPQEVAEELSLMDAKLLRNICGKELKNGAWMKKDKLTLAPNVLAMVHASNHLALLVPTEILSEPAIPSMAKCISAYIKIARRCYRLNNLNSLKAILAGLQCTPVYRLKTTWKEVSARRRKKFDMLSALMSEEHNWKTYNRYLEGILNSNTPCIPFLGVLLTMIVQYDSVRAVRDTTTRYHRSSKTRKISGVEDYTVLEAITVRNRLESIRKRSSSWRMSLAIETGVPSLHSEMHVGFDRRATVLTSGNTRLRANALIIEQEDSESDPSCKATAEATILKSGLNTICESRSKVTSPISILSSLSSDHPSDPSASDDEDNFELKEQLDSDDQLEDVANMTESRSAVHAFIKPQVSVSQIHVQLLGSNSSSASTPDDNNVTVEDMFQTEPIPHNGVEDTVTKLDTELTNPNPKLTDTELTAMSQASSEQSLEQQSLAYEFEIKMYFSSDDDLLDVDSDVADKAAVDHMLNRLSVIRMIPSRSYDGLKDACANCSRCDRVNSSSGTMSRLETGSLDNLHSHTLSAVSCKATPIRADSAMVEDNTSSETIENAPFGDTHQTHPPCSDSPSEFDRPLMRGRSGDVDGIHSWSNSPCSDCSTPSSPLRMRSRSKPVDKRHTNDSHSHTPSRIKNILQFIIPKNILQKRRRPSDLIAISQASTSNLSDPSKLLSRYQMMSLGCSVNIKSNKNVRNILTHSPRNTEMQNYKLSYLRELPPE